MESYFIINYSADLRSRHTVINDNRIMHAERVVREQQCRQERQECPSRLSRGLYSYIGELAWNSSDSYMALSFIMQYSAMHVWSERAIWL